MAVLVQPMLHARVGGVLFGVDPVTGRTDRLVVAASRHGAAAVVSGQVSGSRYVLDRTGGVIDADDSPDDAALEDNERRALGALADRAAAAFGGHPDIEWALDESGAPGCCRAGR